MDPVKIAGVAEWSTLSNKKEVQSFLGFYQFLLPLSSRDSQTLLAQCSTLHGRTPHGSGGSGEISPSKAIRTRVISAPILVFPDETRPFRVEADSSDFATEQSSHNNLRRTTSGIRLLITPKGLSAVEWNYKIHDKEMLAVIRALEDWCHFLEGKGPTTRLKFGRTTRT